MCLGGCGTAIKNKLNACVEHRKAKGLLPEDAQFTIDAEPSTLGIHRLSITIESEDLVKDKEFDTELSKALRESLPDHFHIIENQQETNKVLDKTNLINIVVNGISMVTIICFLSIFPPSILLTTGLTLLSFLTTAFTIRGYLIDFFFNFRHKSFSNMATPISLGWFLSLGHTLFHTITMPLMGSSFMTVMNFIMPIALITCINVMDEIKRSILEKSVKFQLQGIKSLFPEMAKEYRCQQLSPEQMNLMKEIIFNRQDRDEKGGKESVSLKGKKEKEALLNTVKQIFLPESLEKREKGLLKEGMFVEVKQGECFPVDCMLVQKDTVVDDSLVTGEPRQSKSIGMDIPAGAINLAQTVVVYATKSPYESQLNNLLFKSNRARKDPPPKPASRFVYLYIALVMASFFTAIIAPMIFSAVSLPIILENIIGLLFSVCPCTIVIAHKLPHLISIYHRGRKGVHLLHESLNEQVDEIHTLIFDKTGTLTTNSWLVDSPDIPLNSPLWQRIYLLEKHGGSRSHPLAQAIIYHYETRWTNPILFDEVEIHSCDQDSRGLTAKVQGKILHVGNADYLIRAGIKLPENKLNGRQGCSTIYVAEDKIYRGVIYIPHEPRIGIADALHRFKKADKAMIMLTGDNEESAKGFNRQIGLAFKEEDIYAHQTPLKKEAFLKELMKNIKGKPEGVCFVGDGLNDGPCCTVVQEKGLSCSLNTSDRSTFFTDICLNGSLEYLFHHHKVNRFLHQNIQQNQWILAYGIIITLAYTMSLSGAGLAVPPLIPMTMMFSTTLFVLFNSYRTQLFIDNTMDKISAWPKQLLASNWSIGLLLGASSLFTCATLLTIVSTGVLTLPSLSLAGGTLTILSSINTLAAGVLFSLFIGSVISYLVSMAKETYFSPNLPPREQTESQKKKEPMNKAKFFPSQSSIQKKPVQDNEMPASTVEESSGTSYAPF